MKLQGYFDDSGSSRREPVFVLAGFVSTVEKWQAFSDDWKAKLDESPSLDYFKMSEAAALSGEFGRGWNPALRDQRVFELAEIIARHALVRVDSWCYREPFDDIVRGIVSLPEFQDPYALLFYQLIFAVITYRLENDGVTCDLIFDEQGKVLPSRMAHYWEFAKSYAPNPDRMPILETQSAPIFKSDRRYLPLQAADLYAWFVRSNRLARIPGGQPHSLADAISKILRDLPHITRWYDHASMMEIGARLMVWRAKKLGIL
jgi:hypothetical protein